MPSKHRLVSMLRTILGLAIVGLAGGAAYFESQAVLDLMPDAIRTPILIAILCATTGLVWATNLVIVRKIGNGIFESRIRAGLVSTVVGAIVYSLMTAPLVLAYLISWRFLRETGRFPGWEVLKVTATSEYAKWQELGELTPSQTEIFTNFGILAAGVLPVLYVVASIAAGEESKRLKDLVARLWLGCAIVVMGGGLYVLQFAPAEERDLHLAYLSRTSNPLVTLAASAWDSFAYNSVDPEALHSEPLVDRDTDWSSPTSGRKPPIVIVAIESLRHDVLNLNYQGREVTPNLNKLAKNGIRWKRAYAQSTFSDYSDGCIVSSLYPLRSRMQYRHDANERFPVTHIYDLLQPVGYATAVISSRDEASRGTEAFYQSDKLELLHHPAMSANPRDYANALPTNASKSDQELTAKPVARRSEFDATGKAIEWIEKQSDEHKPFFLGLSLNHSVFPYEVSESADQPFTPSELGDDVVFGSFPDEKAANVRNAYFNAIHESDRQLGRLVDALAKRGVFRDTILIVTGKNGEAFQLHGKNGHTLRPVESALHVATVFHAPKYLNPTVLEYPLQHVDLAPTILGMMNWPTHPNFQGIDALAQDREPAKERLLYFHVIRDGTRCDAVLFGGRWKYVLDHVTGCEKLYDVKKDPRETHDITSEQSKLAEYLGKTLTMWRERQLAYYHYPNYYTTAFPPKSPTWKRIKKEIVVLPDESTQPVGGQSVPLSRSSNGPI